MPTLRDLVSHLQSGDTSQPAITFYDRSGGVTDGERIELSSRVLLTWAAKVGGVLQDELDVEVGTTVGLALPPHWRLACWALGAWWVGATVVTGPEALDADVLVTDSPDLAAAHDGQAVLVTLAALARCYPGTVPSGVMDDAREVMTQPDQLVAYDEPDASDVAWRSSYGSLPYDAPLAPSPGRRAAVLGDDAGEDALRLVVAAWAAREGLVLVRASSSPADLATICSQEHVTA